jgi:hypothetical protein
MRFTASAPNSRSAGIQHPQLAKMWTSRTAKPDWLTPYVSQEISQFDHRLIA